MTGCACFDRPGSGGWLSVSATVGVVFKVDTLGNETPLYTFRGGTDGAYPYPGVTRDPAGNLYGTTFYGGDRVGSSGSGVVFEVDTAGREKVLYTFTATTDDSGPIAGVVRDSDGNLFGTTQNAGTFHRGVVYKLTP